MKNKKVFNLECVTCGLLSDRGIVKGKDFFCGMRCAEEYIIGVCSKCGFVMDLANCVDVGDMVRICHRCFYHEQCLFDETCLCDECLEAEAEAQKNKKHY